MSVRHVPAEHVLQRMLGLRKARERTVQKHPAVPDPADTASWEQLFETNATEALATVPSVTLRSGLVVRYRFFGQRERDLLVRPFVARQGTDVEAVRRIIDWHPPPDSCASALAAHPTRDVDLLYRHFSFPWDERGIFDYWTVMQELWASARWTHAQVISSATELAALTAAQGWQVERAVEACEPAVVLAETSARLGVLVHDALDRHSVVLQQIEITADGAVHYGTAAVVANGPRGYIM
jgi:hypothetical protein